MINEILEELKGMRDKDVVDIYNVFAEENWYESVFDLQESDFNELFLDAKEAVNLTNHKLFDDRHRFAFFNGLGHLQTFDNVEDERSPIDLESLARWVVEADMVDEFGF